MHDDVRNPTFPPGGSIEVVSRSELGRCAHWGTAFASERKDHRYYELVEDAIHSEFDYRYFVIRDEAGEVRSVQPFFLLDQDLLAGTTPRIQTIAERLRRLWPRFLRVRTLMVGCVAGEAHLDATGEVSRRSYAQLLAASIMDHARALGAKLVVLKEFPAADREALACFLGQGFARVPSMPMVSLGIDYKNFEQYLANALSHRTRANMRRNFREAARGGAIEMIVTKDITPHVDEIYPLYLAVYERSKLHFEKLSKEFLAGIGRRMPDKARFFLWRRADKVVAFSLCMVHGDAVYSEYIGLDYSVALQLHLYYVSFRDIVTWAMERGYKTIRSSGLNYEPKYHLRYSLDPLDLYVRHTSTAINAILKRVLPLLAPVRNDKTLKRFANHHELQG
jgi:hypothetical protein